MKKPKAGVKQRIQRSDAELRAAAEHVRYEMEMLACSALYVPIGISSPAVDETKNLALEAFLLHYRNLRAFLCPSLQATCDDDVLASDFLHEPTPVDMGDPKELGIDKTRIDKLLAHISYERARYEEDDQKRWNPQQMQRRIQNGIVIFLRRLSPERRGWFRADFRQ